MLKHEAAKQLFQPFSRRGNMPPSHSTGRIEKGYSSFTSF